MLNRLDGVFLGILCLGAIFCACTATHSVRTVGKGNAALEMSLGGPLITNLGGAIPAPNLFVAGRYGVRDDLDLSLAYNLTSPIVPGIVLDGIFTAHYVPIQPGIGRQQDTPDKGWSLATAAGLHLLTDFTNGAVLLPAVELAGGWRYKWFNPYLGLSLALHFYRPYDQNNPAFLSPFVGADFMVNRRVSLGLRLTFYDVLYNMWGSQVEWVYLVADSSQEKKFGMVGLSLAFSYDFIQNGSGNPQNGRNGGAP